MKCKSFFLGAGYIYIHEYVTINCHFLILNKTTEKILSVKRLTENLYYHFSVFKPKVTEQLESVDVGKN